MEHNVPELAADSLSSKIDHIEILKNSVSILANVIEKISESEKPRHKMMMSKHMIRGNLKNTHIDQKNGSSGFKRLLPVSNFSNFHLEFESVFKTCLRAEKRDFKRNVRF